MKREFVKTENARRFRSTLGMLEGRGALEAGMLLVVGRPGEGKTMTLHNWAAEVGAVMLTAQEGWTPNRMLSELAEKLGLDLQTFFDISSKASGQSWSMTSYCPVPGVGPETPADRDYQGGFAAALMLKDLRLAMQAADEAGASTPLGAHAAQLYEAFVADGHGGTDFSGIIKTL